jgi:diguanylate cyclase (GGDEF)-like protein/PAS domain S-box-containing protein
MLNLLYLEDDPADFLLVSRHLQRQGMAANVVRVEDRAALSAALENTCWDVILADYNVPGVQFRDVLALLCAERPNCPVILVSGSLGDEAAVELLKEGLWDFVLKDNLSRLCPAIERGLRDAALRSARQSAERSLQESEERFRLIAATITDVIWLSDLELRRITYVSPAYESLWQQECAVLYRDPRAFIASIHADDVERVTGDLRVATRAGKPFDLTFRVVRPDGTMCWVLNRGFPAPSPTGQPTRYVGVAKDVTERHRDEERLRQAATVFESTREGVMIADLDNRILAVNKAFTDITGYRENEVLGRSTGINRSGRHTPEFYQAMWSSLRNTGQWQGEIWNRCKNGEVYPAWLSISTVHDERDRPTHYVGVFSDISQIKRSEAQLARLAHYDPLTGLPNRLLLESRLEQAIGRAARHDRRTAVLFIDLDHFKTVNDSLGHVVGDQLLLDVSRRMRERARDEDSLGRFGGDEFLLLLEPIGQSEEAAIVARDILESLEAPFKLSNGNEIFVRASIGISVYPEDGATTGELLRGADVAMYQAKEHGRNRFCFYTADMNEHAMMQLEVEAALRRAMERNEFVLHYQPKADLRTGRIVGAEALIRWQRESGELESPARFIPLAERTGLIVPIGGWVIDTACRQLKVWREGGWPDLKLAINVSGQQFNSGDLAGVVAQALACHGIPPASLELEVTESMLMNDPEQTIATLKALKQTGVKLSLDDFGTGYSSFAYLSRFPIDTLKIDQSFVRDIVSEPEAAMIAVSIIDLAHRMGLNVVAEGVETAAQLGYLKMRHCDEMQGYFFAGPMPAESFLALVREGKCLPPVLAAGMASMASMADPIPANRRAVVADGELEKKPRTLLLVDDEENILTSLRRLLRTDGYRILIARSGNEGLELLAQNEVDVILSDQRMPGMTGVEFLRRVKTIHPNTVRMVLSGYTELQSITDAINEGSIYKFLTKPWEDGLLRANIEEAFRYKELTDENLVLQTEVQIANKELALANARLRETLVERERNLELSGVSLNVVQEVLQCLPYPVLGMDGDDMVVFANEEAQRVFGRNTDLLGLLSDEVLPVSLAELVRGSDGDRADWRQGGEAWNVLLRHLDRQGTGPTGHLLILTPAPTLSRTLSERGGQI